MKTKQSFLVNIIEKQNATWQGTVTWLNQNKTESFRSLLELIKLIDVVVEKEGNRL